MELCCSGVLSGGGGGATRAAPRPRRTQKLGKRGVSVSSPGFSLARPNRRRGCRPQLEPRAPPCDERNPAGAESVVHMLKSAAGPAEALELFKSVAQQANIVHTMESCNYMLELMRAHGRVGDMAQVFDLMQRQIIKANVSTFATIFRGLVVEGGLRSAPVPLPVMKGGDHLERVHVQWADLFPPQAGRFEDAYQILGKMEDEGCKPDVITHTVLIKSSL